MEYILGFLGITVFETILTFMAFGVLSYIVVRKVRNNHGDATEELGEDVPPEFPGTMRPKSLPRDFGRSPGRE